MEDSTQPNPEPGAIAEPAKLPEIPKAEVSASTIGRMMGLATVSDLKMLDAKLDMVSTKVVGLVVKMDKMLTAMNSVATAADLERVDVQIGSLKTTLRESVQAIQDLVVSKQK